MGAVRRRRLCRGVLAATGAAAVALAAPPAAPARQVRAQAAGACSLTQREYRSSGYSYLTYLWVYRTSCATGLSLAKHHGRVSGWRCRNKVIDKSSFVTDAQMTCTGGGREVVWKYEQDH